MRKPLTPAAITASIPAVNNDTCVPLSPNWFSISATSAAPLLCPSSRAVPNIPLAPPLRSRGAEVIIVWLFGD